MQPCPLCQYELEPAAWSALRCPDCGGDLTAFAALAASTAEAEISDSTVVRQSLLLYAQRFRNGDSETNPGATPEASQTMYFGLGGAAANVPTDPRQTAREANLTTHPEQGNQPPTVNEAEATQPADEMRGGDISQPPVDPTALTGVWSLTHHDGEASPRQTIKPKSSAAARKHANVNHRVLGKQWEGRTRDADYELLETIGEGGIGLVYAARQGAINRTVAVKMLKPSANNNPQQHGEFLAEAIVTGELDHPNIVPIYELGSNDQGALFYSMKRVRGQPWSKVAGEKSLVENLDILLKVADALAFAHSRHVVHRDLKPENVMLGDFGEVLLMDWGLALPIGPRRHQPWPHAPGMGGTPAYMAPEMATGSLDDLDERADIYLLGAILFELITGRTPHTGADVMACLLAAARNEIVTTRHEGELIDLAKRCMSTERQKRPASVHEFQDAIRAYRSHSESIALATRGQDDLARAHATNDYQDYSRALFAFQEAIALWTGNARAREGVVQAKLDYATAAQEKGDLDLAQSLLDPRDSAQAPLLKRVEQARTDRASRQQRLTAFKRLAVMLVGLMVVLAIASYVQIRRDRDRAMVAEQSARDDRDRALVAEEQARTAARTAETEAEKARQAEVAARREFERAKTAEMLAKESADKARIAEGEARTAATVAENAKKAESIEAYFARIGAVTSRIDDNAFGSATSMLEACELPLRHWEWGRLMHLCGPNLQAYRTGRQVDSARYSPDGKWVAAACWDGQVHLWPRDQPDQLTTLKYDAQYVHSVAFSPDSRRLAVGGANPRGYLQLYDLATGAVQQTFVGHDDNVLDVSFSRDGKRLLTCSYDYTARLWEVESGRELQRFDGHNWWVWSARFAPPTGNNKAEERVVTASQDGTVLVWQIDSAKKSPPFTGHQGAVFAAEFSPDGKWVASAGNDKRVLLWQPEKLKPFNFDNVLDSEPQASAEYAALEGHTAAVRSIAFSHDGKQLLSGSHDNTLRVWNVADRSLYKSLRAHAGWVRSGVFSQDDTKALSASLDGRVLQWDIAEHAEQRVVGHRVLQGHSDAVLAAAFSPDDRSLITAGRDHTARLWDPRSTREQRQFVEGHGFLASRAVFLPQTGEQAAATPAQVATAGADGTVRIWDLARGVQVHKLDDTGRAAALAAAPSGKYLATGNDKLAAILWDADTGERLSSLARSGGETSWLAFSPDDRWLYVGDEDGRGQLWDRAAGKALHTLRGQTARISGAAFVAGGQRLLTASADNSVCQWNVLTGEELKERLLRHPDAVTSLATTHDGQFALTSCGDMRVRLWNVDTATVVRELPLKQDAVHSVALSADGALAATVNSVARTVRLWNMRTGTEIRSPRAAAGTDPWLDMNPLGALVWAAVFTEDGQSLLTLGGTEARIWNLQTGHETQQLSPHGAVAAVAFSPDGKWVATGSWDQSAKIWDASTGLAERRLAGRHTGHVNAVAFSPDGKTLLTASDDGEVHASLVGTGEATGKPWVHPKGVRCIAYHPAGNLVATGCDDHAVRLWNPQSGELLATLTGHEWTVNSVAFSVDGKRLASAGSDNRAILWDPHAKTKLQAFEGHSAGVNAVAFAADNERLITGSQDNLVKLWELATGKEVLTLKGHTEEVTSVGFSHSGYEAFSASRDGTVIIWPAVEWGWGAQSDAPDPSQGKRQPRG